MMNIEAMEEISRRVARIHGLREELKRAEEKLKLLNRCVDPAKRDTYAWRPSLILQKAEGSYGTREISVSVDLPFGVVQQQCVYEVERIKREIILLGDLA
jgi:hypothetical protein